MLIWPTVEILEDNRTHRPPLRENKKVKHLCDNFLYKYTINNYLQPHLQLIPKMGIAHTKIFHEMRYSPAYKAVQMDHSVNSSKEPNHTIAIAIRKTKCTPIMYLG